MSITVRRHSPSQAMPGCTPTKGWWPFGGKKQDAKQPDAKKQDAKKLGAKNFIASGDRSCLAERSDAWQSELAASGETEIGIHAFLAHETPEFAWGPTAS